MGGGTGTGAAPTIADIAREAGILTVGVVTKPFKFEGKRRMDQAMVGINELLGKVDSLLIIPNDRLKFATDQKVTLANAFEIADDVLRQAVVSISDLIKNTGFINLDFADVTCVMKDAGFAHMGVGRAAGKGKAEDAARMAVASPLMETSINGARGVLINITGSEDMGLEDVETAQPRSGGCASGCQHHLRRELRPLARRRSARGPSSPPALTSRARRRRRLPSGRRCRSGCCTCRRVCTAPLRLRPRLCSGAAAPARPLHLPPRLPLRLRMLPHPRRKTRSTAFQDLQLKQFCHLSQTAFCPCRRFLYSARGGSRLKRLGTLPASSRPWPTHF